MDGITHVGKTVTGQPVIAGLFALHSTYGVPLVVLFDWCQHNGLIPSWEHFLEEAAEEGWTRATTVRRLSEAIRDSYPAAWGAVVIQRLDAQMLRHE